MTYFVLVVLAAIIWALFEGIWLRLDRLEGRAPERRNPKPTGRPGPLRRKGDL